MFPTSSEVRYVINANLAARVRSNFFVNSERGLKWGDGSLRNSSKNILKWGWGGGGWVEEKNCSWAGGGTQGLNVGTYLRSISEVCTISFE